MKRNLRWTCAVFYLVDSDLHPFSRSYKAFGLWLRALLLTVGECSGCGFWWKIINTEEHNLRTTTRLRRAESGQEGEAGVRTEEEMNPTQFPSERCVRATRANG